METKANYFLIGLFTLAGLLGSLVFLLWLAKVEVDRLYAYYDVLFDDVAGLGNAGDVRYNGLPVGRVVNLRLDPDDPSKVRVRIEVNADTPIKTDTVAVLQGQGVTGVSYVALSGGSPDAEQLPEESVIIADRSPWQSVLEGAPVLLQKAVDLLEDINDVVNDENRAAVDQVLENLTSASGRLDRAMEDFETLSSDLSLAAREVAGFTGRLEALADTADTTLTTATETLTQAQGAISRGEQAFATANDTLNTIDEAFASAKTLIEGDGTDFLRQGTVTAATLDNTLTSLQGPAQNALENATAALGEAEQTFASANKILDEDIDDMITDIRAAVTAFTETTINASENIDEIADEVLAASRSAANFASTLENVVVRNRTQITNFFRLGLPEFLQLTEDARLLVRNMTRFVDRLDRDPARYFFGTQGSEFSR